MYKKVSKSINNLKLYFIKIKMLLVKNIWIK